MEVESELMLRGIVVGVFQENCWVVGNRTTGEAICIDPGADPDEVAITHNTTEGFNLLAQGLPLGPGDEVLFSSMNHDGASVCWDHHASKKGYAVRRFDFPVTDVPRLTADDLTRHLEPIQSCADSTSCCS